MVIRGRRASQSGDLSAGMTDLCNNWQIWRNMTHRYQHAAAKGKSAGQSDIMEADEPKERRTPDVAMVWFVLELSIFEGSFSRLFS